MKIDIYGKCGDHKVPELPKKIDNTLSKQEAGYKMFVAEYKFYLSFENSLCTEYITEKFFNALKYGTIPIAYGGLTSHDYAKIAPPKSYLHVDDYQNPEDLARKLEELAGNPAEYESYFWWRNYYELNPDVRKSAQCHLCEILNNIKKHKTKNNYSHFKKYWHNCRSPSV